MPSEGNCCAEYGPLWLSGGRREVANKVSTSFVVSHTFKHYIREI